MSDPTTKPRQPARPRRRPSRRTVRAASWLAAAAAFGVPWAVVRATPSPPTGQAAGRQVITLPGGQRVVIPSGSVGPNGVSYVYVGGPANGRAAAAPSAPVATTRASAVARP